MQKTSPSWFKPNYWADTFLTMVVFSKPRLEGKALEQILAGDARRGIRMREGSSGKWVTVNSEEAKEALAYMKTRAKRLVDDLKAKGFVCSGGDMPVLMEDKDVEGKLF